ncbi:MAG TPA: 16S rRNA (cytosine(1402)-N(4))-methyltransferase [Armatimonadetes bacterium]|nr:16S rRNA (cytosine(1402)-N(4))-methyltransferase [Armatimonadota bacterium]
MVAECLEALALSPGDTVVDGTVGQGGHLRALLRAVQPGGRAIGCDLDSEALTRVEAWLGEEMSAVTLVQGSFADLAPVVRQQVPGGVQGILLDLGVSRDQLISPRFSFQAGGPLDSRLDPAGAETAADLLARADEAELTRILRDYGDERFAPRIARGIVAARAQAPLTTTEQLVEVIRRAYPAGARHGRIHIATRTFQALRIAVNRLYEALDTALAELPALLAPGGRLAILTYHSGEDGRVKRAFRALSRAADDGTPAGFSLLTRRPLAPSPDECAANPGARSARLRVLLANPARSAA